MPKQYSAEPLQPTYEPLTDADHIAIGRIIRAIADLEDCITLFIMQLVGISESEAGLMLGKLGIKARRECAENLAKVNGAGAQEAFAKGLGGSTIIEAIDCRNAVAHGIYRGRSKDGHLVFLTDKKIGIEGASVQRISEGYHPTFVNELATNVTQALPEIRRILQIQEPFEARLQRPLKAHPKGRKKKGSGTKPPSPPPPSQA